MVEPADAAAEVECLVLFDLDAGGGGPFEQVVDVLAVGGEECFGILAVPVAGRIGEDCLYWGFLVELILVLVEVR